jgi:hypothetical protein
MGKPISQHWISETFVDYIREVYSILIDSAATRKVVKTVSLQQGPCLEAVIPEVRALRLILFGNSAELVPSQPSRLSKHYSLISLCQTPSHLSEHYSLISLCQPPSPSTNYCLHISRIALSFPSDKLPLHLQITASIPRGYRLSIAL